MTTRAVTLLLVDDNEVDVEGVQRGLRRARIANEVRVAGDGRAALELLRDEGDPFPRPFIVLLDLNMPRMNGLEFLEAIRDDPELADSVVFILTTSDADEDKVKAYQHHVAGYIVKSRVGDGFSQLVSMLDRYCRSVELPAPAAEGNG